MALSNELKAMHRIVRLLEDVEKSDGRAARNRVEEYIASRIESRCGDGAEDADR